MKYSLALMLFVGLVPSSPADLATLTLRQKRLDDALGKVTPALVAVEDRFGAGSGIVVSSDGIVFTASHVVQNQERVSRNVRVRFPDGETYSARVLGMNRSADAAMLQITEPYRKAGGFPFVELGRETELRKGDWCFAIGHPGGYRAERPAPVRLGRVLSIGHNTIVSDCAIVLGDSGGPLFDLKGRLIGIHSMITEIIVENRHVSIDVFRRDGDRMEEGGIWGRLIAQDNDLAYSGFFGVQLRWSNFSAEVLSVVSGGPASLAGIRKGDILLAINEQKFADALGLSNMLAQFDKDDEIDIKVERRRSQRTVSVKLGKYPDRRELRELRSSDRELPVEYYREIKNQLSANRKVGAFEKRNEQELRRYRPVTRNASNSVVELRLAGEQRSLGVVMSRDGYIMTKASELDDAVKPECVLPDGRRIRLRKVAVDRAFDLLLLKAEARLTPVEWSTKGPPEPGRMLISTDGQGNPMLPGVVSVKARPLASSQKGFLGVSLRDSNYGGVQVMEVIRSGAAFRAGIQKDDVVLSIDGQRMTSVSQMVRKVGGIAPNSDVKVVVLRDNQQRNVDVVLTPRFVPEYGEEVFLSRYNDRENRGKYASLNNSGYPDAIQTDTDLYPHQAGGPVYDLSGKAVAMNISRSARVVSYAIPARSVLKVYDQLRQKDNNR